MGDPEHAEGDPGAGTEPQPSAGPAEPSSLSGPDPGGEPIIVGVTPGQCEEVVTEAARLAERMDASLVCAYVEPLQRGVFEGAGGTMLAVPVDAETAPEPTPFPETMRTRVLELAEPYGIECAFSRPVGEISIALGELGESTGAHTIVVGTRRPGVRAGIAEFFAGSVAAHLTHRQPRPVLVVPVSPAAAHEALPWDEE